MKNDLIAILNIAIEKYKDSYYQGKSAQLSFYFTMSVIPTIFLLTKLLATFSITTEILQMLLSDYLSEKGLDLVHTFLNNNNQSDGMSFVFIFLALWGASKAQFALMGISNYAYTGNSRGNGYVQERLRAIKNSLFMLFLLLFGLILLVYGDIILNALLVILGTDFIRILEKVFGDRFDLIWVLLRWVLGLVLYGVAVLYILYNAPTKKMKLHQVIPGSLIASIGMVIVTAVYSAYTNYTMQNSNPMNSIYGSFSSIIALLFWFFLLGSALILGILANASLNHLRVEQSNRDDTFDV